MERSMDKCSLRKKYFNSFFRLFLILFRKGPAPEEHAGFTFVQIYGVDVFFKVIKDLKFNVCQEVLEVMI